MTHAAHNLFIISGPSGAGEDSVLNGLREEIDFAQARTTSSRPMRPGETDGDPYHFVATEEFEALLAQDALIEHDKHNGHYYGLTRESLEGALATGKIVILKTDYMGVISTKKLYPESVAILISAPLDVIGERIRARGGLSEEQVSERLNYARGWFENREAFDYEVENKQGKLAETITHVADIMRNRESEL